MTIPDDARNKPYTPGLIGRIYARSVSSSVEKNLVFIQGIYVCIGKKPYKGFYYDQLKDEVSGECLVMKVHETLRVKLEHNKMYLFKGSVEPEPNKKEIIGVTITFTPSEIIGTEAPTVDERTQKIVNLFREKSLKRNVNVDKLLLRMLYAGNKPRICLIYGNEAIVDRDVQSALQGLAGSYEISEARINLSDKQTIIASLKKAANAFDAVCIVRGGGGGLEIFDDLDIAETVINLKNQASVASRDGSFTAFICAVGHSSDTTLLRQISDKFCPTPTALGTYLAELVRETQQNKIEKIEVPVVLDISGIKIKMFIYGAVAALIAGTIIFFFIR